MSFAHFSPDVFAFSLLVFNGSLYIKATPLCTLDSQSDSQAAWSAGKRDRPCQGLSAGWLAPGPQPAEEPWSQAAGSGWAGRALRASGKERNREGSELKSEALSDRGLMGGRWRKPGYPC